MITKLILTIVTVLLTLPAWAGGIMMVGGGTPVASCSGTIGNTSTTYYDTISGNNTCFLVKITANCSGKPASLNVYQGYNQCGSSRDTTLVIYADNGSGTGPTGSALEYSSANCGHSTLAWTTWVPTTNLTNGTVYWMGTCNQDLATSQNYSASGGGDSYSGTVSNYAAPGAITGSANSRPYSIYMSY